MIVARHPDGRVILMAQEHGLKPMLRGADGTWTEATITGGELQEFIKVRSESERQSILRDGRKKAGRASIIGGDRSARDQKPAKKATESRIASKDSSGRKQLAARSKSVAISGFEKLAARMSKLVASGGKKAASVRNRFTGEPTVKAAYASKATSKRASKASA